MHSLHHHPVVLTAAYTVQPPSPQPGAGTTGDHAGGLSRHGVHRDSRDADRPGDRTRGRLWRRMKDLLRRFIRLLEAIDIE
ncbi:hypothetical protein [Streptomyces sp. NPDC059874]|uniref:hypothetical protein n=1 Tax=Streptomyces sp. NPDC059874 TaxID=3346983 RepID=UPI00365DA9AC